MAFIAREEKSVPGFKSSKDRLTLLLGLLELVTLHWCQCSCIILKIPGPFRIMQNLLCLCSIFGTTKPGWNHICLQHGLLHILNSVMRPIDQEKKIPLKILLLIEDAPGHPRGLIKKHNKMNVVYMPANTMTILQPTDQGLLKLIIKGTYFVRL